MPVARRSRRLTLVAVLFFILYLVFCSVGGIFVADGTLHPARRPLTQEEETTMRQTLDAEIEDVSITTQDNVVLSAWIVRPRPTSAASPWR